MSIKPAMGWLALLLFTTTAQAEGSRDLFTRPPKTSKAPVAAVTPKTKALPPAAAIPVAATTAGALLIVESTGKPRADYEAEAYAGVALDSPLSVERGLDGGLVSMVFEHQRRPAFRVGRDRIRRVVRLAADDRGAMAIVRSAPTARPKDHIDVLDTDAGVVLVDTAVLSAGMFVTSDVYVFSKHSTLDQRIAALEAVPAPARERLREALVAAEWAPIR